MLASVTASVLNVRSSPNISGRVLGVLNQDAIINVKDKSEKWFEIQYQSLRGFVFGEYVEAINESKPLRGVVTASILNIREEPTLNAGIIGRIGRGTQISITFQTDTWLEILFNEQVGYVVKTFIDVFPVKPSFRARVTADMLNVRSMPSIDSHVIGQVYQGKSFDILSLWQDWAEIKLNGQTAYLHAGYIEKIEEDVEQRIVSVDDEIHSQEVEQVPNSVANALDEPVSLEPTIKIPIQGNPIEKKVARAWNQFGGLLTALSQSKEIDVACIVAVLCVESSGQGFDANNQNRMIIRFENHKFWRYWGKKNPDTYRQYFEYRADKVWLGHKWRANPGASWQKFHGKQEKEWQVLQFAQTLDSDAAKLSISMGAPQIMGFHYERLGFESVSEMFHQFNAKIDAQIQGLFDFFSPSMLRNLRNEDFVSFAGAYNGSGQKNKYGKWIDDHFRAFKRLESISNLN